MQKHAWLPALEDMITLHTLHQSFASYINLLPMRQRVDFKLAVLVFNAFNDLAPHYLLDDCQLAAASRRRVSDSFKCSITSRALVHVSAIVHFLLPGQEIGTVCLRKPVSLICHLTVLPEAEDVFCCSRHQRLVTVAFMRRV